MGIRGSLNTLLIYSLVFLLLTGEFVNKVKTWKIYETEILVLYNAVDLYPYVRLDKAKAVMCSICRYGILLSEVCNGASCYIKYDVIFAKTALLKMASSSEAPCTSYYFLMLSDPLKKS